MQIIENQIFRGLLYNEQYTQKVFPYLNEDFFDGPYKIIYNTYANLYNKYLKKPNLDSLAIEIRKLPLVESTYTDIVDAVSGIVKCEEPPDYMWLINETEEYCRDRAIYNAVEQSIKIIQGEDKKLDKNSIPSLLDSALSISFDTTVGMDFFDDAELRYENYISEDNRLKTPLEALNILTNGGLKNKSLIATLAFTNVGKSALMCYLAGEFMKMGHNVLYISMEMDEQSVLERVEANLLSIKTDDLKKMEKRVFVEKINSIKNKTRGRLIVKEYPTSSAHTGHFRHLLKELAQKKKFSPRIIFIDYINICASSRYKTMSGINSYSYIKAIAEELRGLASEFNVPIWTATQTNRDNANSTAPDMTATSDSLGLPMTLDFFMAQTATDVHRENDQQLWHLLKTRWGNKSHIQSQIVGVNYDYMRFYDINGNNNTKEIQNKIINNKPQKLKKVSEIVF